MFRAGLRSKYGRTMMGARRRRPLEAPGVMGGRSTRAGIRRQGLEVPSSQPISREHL